MWWKIPLFSGFTLYNAGVGCYIFGNPDVAAYGGAATYGDATENGCVGVDDDVVFEYGVAGYALDGVALLVEREALGAESNALIQFYVLADDGRSADDDTRAVVDGEVFADGGCRVYVDAGLGVGHLGEDTGYGGYALRVQPVGQRGS